MFKHVIFVCLVIIIASCSTSQPQPTHTSAPPTATPSPKVEPTDTSIPPTETQTTIPTETLLPTITPTPPPLGEEGNPIVWAMLQWTDPELFYSALDQAVEIMNERTGLVVEPVLTTNFSQIVEMLCSGEAHFGPLGAFSYIAANERGCAEIALSAELFEGSIYQSQILVREDSGIESIQELAGVTYCRTSDASTSSWIIPSLMMMAKGIDPENDFVEIIDTGNPHKNVIKGIYNGVCEAGATHIEARTNALNEYPDVLNVVTVLAGSIQIPRTNISFNPNLPTEMQEEIINSFFYMEIFESGQIIQDLFGWSGLFERGDYLYDPLRGLINEAGVEVESYYD